MPESTRYVVQVATGEPEGFKPSRPVLAQYDADPTVWKTAGDYTPDERREARAKAQRLRDGKGWPVVRVVCHQKPAKYDDANKTPRQVTETIMQRMAKPAAEQRQKRGRRRAA